MSSKQSHQALPSGYRIHWYEIDSVLGQGGFGITYLAHDINLNQRVAVKEFLPAELAARTSDETVHPLTDGHIDTYGWGLNRFITEAQTLAQFRHRHIVRVLSVFEMNNTAYMIMEYEDGRSFAQAMNFNLLATEADLRRVLMEIMDGLEAIHAAGFIHRDIKPENIYLRDDGSAVLLDFGSARQAVGGETRTLTALVTPGYAPYEQYGSGRDDDRQGPWTDIYGLGATLYRAVTGRGPIDAMTRVNAILDSKPDPLIPALSHPLPQFGASLLASIDHALAFHPKDRPQSIAEWRADLDMSDEFAETQRAPMPVPDVSGARSGNTERRTGATGADSATAQAANQSTGRSTGHSTGQNMDQATGGATGAPTDAAQMDATVLAGQPQSPASNPILWVALAGLVSAAVAGATVYFVIPEETHGPPTAQTAQPEPTRSEPVAPSVPTSPVLPQPAPATETARAAESAAAGARSVAYPSDVVSSAEASLPSAEPSTSETSGSEASTSEASTSRVAAGEGSPEGTSEAGAERAQAIATTPARGSETNMGRTAQRESNITESGTTAPAASESPPQNTEETATVAASPTGDTTTTMSAQSLPESVTDAASGTPAAESQDVLRWLGEKPLGIEAPETAAAHTQPQPEQPIIAQPAPASPPPPPPKVNPNAGRIKDLLTKARTDLARMRLTTPAGNNATERFREVLDLDPGNEDALNGLDTVVDAYIKLTNRAVLRGSMANAREYLAKGRTVMPDSLALADAEARVDTAVSRARERQAAARAAEATAQAKREADARARRAASQARTAERQRQADELAQQRWLQEMRAERARLEAERKSVVNARAAPQPEPAPAAVDSALRRQLANKTLHAFRSSGHSFFVEINGDGSFRYEIPMLDDYGSGQWKINNRVLCFYGIAGHNGLGDWCPKVLSIRGNRIVLFEHGREKNWKIIKQ